MDEGTAGVGIDGSLRRGDALDRALAELLRVARHPLLGDIGEHRRDGAAEPGRRAAEEADPGPAQNRRESAAPLLAGEPDAALDPHDVQGPAQRVLDHAADLGEGEQPDHDDEEGHPLLEFRHAHGEARPPALQVDADGRDREAEEDRDQALGEGIRR